MKSILMSIQPRECHYITIGRQTIIVNKTKPKLTTPFKCYIYCTGKEYDKVFCIDEFMHKVFLDGEGKQKVIGEFICDKIDKFRCCSVPYQKENNLGYGHFVDNGVYKVNGWFEGIVFERNDRYIDSMLKNNDLKEMCLSAQEIFDYIGMGKHLYAWHISNLKIYDKPKELSEFKRPCNKEHDCCVCDRYDYMGHKCFDEITRPPQSWCYVEEL